MPVQRHLDAPHRRRLIARFTCEDEAWSGGIIWVLLSADDTEVHR